MNYLSLLILIFSPLIFGTLLFSPFFKNNEVKIRRFSKGFASVHFLYTLMFLAFFNPDNSGISYYKELRPFGMGWIDSMGFKFAFGIDGIALLMVVLTSFIVLLALIASKSNIRERHKFYYSMIFLLQTAILGVFCARDMFLFFVFWELELIPMYFLIGQWGDKKAKASAMKFVLYTFLGSLFMLLGMLILHFYNFASMGELTADFSQIMVSSPDFPMPLQILVSILLLIGFAVKMPVVPLHTWLPDAHVDAPTPVSMILASILLKMGAFGIVRFNMQMLPEAFKIIAPFLAILAVINIIYTAFVAYAQRDLKRIVAYSSISNMGIVLLGLCSLNLIGFSGAIFQMISHGLISAGLFMLVGVIYVRTKTRDVSKLGGLGAVMPRLMGFGIILSMAAVGLPLLTGFIGEFLVFLGAFNSQIDTALMKLYSLIGLLILILSACYVLRFLHKSFFENIFEKWSDLKDITNHEFFVLGALSVAVMFFGIFPMTLLNVVQPVLSDILQFLKI